MTRQQFSGTTHVFKGEQTVLLDYPLHLEEEPLVAVMLQDRVLAFLLLRMMAVVAEEELH